MNKILFLDFDGVLRFENAFSGSHLELLADILDGIGARVVITSDWRKQGQEWCRAMIGDRLSRLVHPDWCTSVLGDRWVEISIWLHLHPDFEHYCILDDFRYHFDGAPDAMLDRLILCSNRYGLVAKMGPVIRDTLLR